MSAVLSLLRELIAQPSVTPHDAGILDLLAERLGGAGYRTERFDAGGTANLWATRGEGPVWLCVNGHVDVVPPGEGWSGDPFTPVERDGHLVGRGACDMKASVAAAVVALETARPEGVALLLTSDEEGPADHGTAYALDRLLARGQVIESALVIEPTSVETLGDFYKPGRRGSLTGRFEVAGVQGHVAYPDRADNAAHRAARFVARLLDEAWDAGDGFFPPTSMQVFDLAAGVGASNVVPGAARVGINFRNAPASPAESLIRRTEAILAETAPGSRAAWSEGASPFLSAPAEVADRIRAAVEAVTGRAPAPSTGGGTSDARAFAARGIEVAEFGPVPVAMHGADERIRIADLEPLAEIYRKIVA